MTTLREPAFQKLRSNVAVLDIVGNPLACSCSIVWLQAWLRDSGREDEAGPRCADGSLLKELRLSRQECQERSTTEVNQPAGSCDADTGTTVLGTSQILSTWVEVKDSTPTPNVAPSPEESEYFYDEYVEYQYEDGNSTSPGNISSNHLVGLTTPQASAAVQTVVATSSSTAAPLSSHYIPGDTPTLYAGIRHERNKTHVEPLKIPQPATPSSSGLTFFGIPLPSLGLGRLWGSTRKSDSKPGDVKFIGARGKVNMLPPTAPHVQTGGFVPMMPESGGFMPIVNPLLTQNRSQGAHLNAQHQFKVNYSSWDYPRTNKTLHLSNLTLVSSHEQNSNTQRGPLPVLMPPLPLPQSTTKPHTSTLRTVNSDTVPIQTNFLDPLALHTSQTRPTPQSPEQLRPSTMHSITTIIPPDEQDSTAASVSINELGHILLPQSELTRIPSLETEFLTTVQSKPEQTLPPSTVQTVTDEHHTTTAAASQGWGFHWFGKPTSDAVKATETSPAETTTSPLNNVIGISTETDGSRRNTPSSLSALLVPGGQQPQFRPPGGRSTITKVTVAPPGPEPVEEYLRGPEPSTNTRSTQELSNFNTEKPQNNSMEWYFKNYNRTNLEPYIGPGKKPINGNNSQASISIFAMLLVAINLV